MASWRLWMLCLAALLVLEGHCAPARIVPGDCSVTISNWRVQGSCQVENMFMLNDNYTCTWRENSARITGDFHGQQKYYNNLNREYWKAVCSFSKVMPVDQKEFTYRIEISPGSQDFFVEIINILPPNKPEYNCTDNVTEGSNVTCICTSLNMGNPPANLSWDGKTDGILLLQDVQRENDNSKYTCRLTWGPNGFINHTIVYTLRVVGKEQTSAANVKAWMIGGIVAAVMLITIIGTLITIFIVKRQKGTICKGKINLRFWPCASYFCHRKKRLSQSRDVVNSSQTPIIRHAAPSGDLYTVVMTTTSGQVEDEYVTLSQTTENTEIDKVCNPQESQDMAQMTESRTRPTLQSQRTTAWGRNFSDLTGTCYMNVTEVPTDSGLGVYHIVPWAVVPTQHQPDTGVYSEAVISEEEYNVLQFQEDRTRQEDHADIYHRIQHS
ncbi:uncharacterized protein LOC112568149 isoform X2 [Pomacea canaliculata]|uniref:uncharacterized protein LOC112568149 isoform X2 n=1 Tax=Pomacea canaliculata TaxID=400727 RepID=UPI000D73C552|nr:uncharacterized protein LOC112568149 isoform X2 [Pomacea canaliculata]